jgi:hypothetical protein
VAIAGQRQRGGFTWPEQVPWSELGEDFVEAWARDDQGRPHWEGLEATGQTGSGKSYAVATLMQERARRWDTAELVCLSKNTDDSMPLLGWPVVQSYDELRSYRQATFWPQTELVGDEREDFHEPLFYDLLANLWPKPGQQANCVVYLDEVRYLESLAGPGRRRARMRRLIRQYWREGRSHGIATIAGAQRPISMLRDQHSETRWKLVFPPADEGDMPRFAELLGRPAEWAPVLESLDQQAHQFVLRNSFTKQAYITWIDTELRPLPSQSADAQRDRAAPAAPYGAGGSGIA